MRIGGSAYFKKGKENLNMTELFHGVSAMAAYLLPLGIIMLLLRRFTDIPKEVCRKLLHFIFIGAYIPLLFAFETWWVCAALILSVTVLLVPILPLVEKIPGFSFFVNERKAGEFTKSMLSALCVMALFVTVGWGLLKDRFLVLAGVYAWGVGDAFAALIGTRFGKHKIRWRFADAKKSAEGSFAMLAASSVAVFVILLIRGGVHAGVAAGIAVFSAAASALVELCSKNGLDNVFCPLVSMAVIVPLLSLSGG